MAQRHKSLIPLAQDHYHGLLLVQQLRERGRVIMAGWPSEPVGQAHHIAQFYQEHLKTHFEAEEQALFPLASQHVQEAKPIVEELLDEHRRVEQFITKFQNAREQSIEPELGKFSSLLEQHIRKEDRVLFPLLEEKAPAEVLTQIATLLHPFYDDPKDDTGGKNKP